ncbi:lipopolysaccharide assembly protein LapA domain-containing protein [Marinicella gelatinilytica]|uniref:lipopolysaccharide assembly protein LapA domain-containing protein n=1 Tax=Marinicella gelatinilytica TaxID=2996017 RepID=UPI002260C5BE|nr:lipopolysaccharide assembly protein LapA domain-containing protein [Marinicella gelatinilytica]MCX7543931.1 lipopolysaccharide assembly protein LapA domain-containing protein [Marinicella gelatinilytica]
MKTLKKTLVITLIVILLSFIITLSALNLDASELNMYFFKLNASLGFIVLMTLIAGVVIGSLISWLLWLWPANREKRHWQRQYHQLRQQTEQNDKPKRAINTQIEAK